MAVCGCFLLFRPVSTALAQYNIDSWTTDNGLPHNAVRDILQTRDGYLWLATADGLVRFDGVRFTTFNRENSPGMVGTRITALLQDNNGDLWMGSDGSVMRLHNGVFTGYGAESGVPNGMVSGIMLHPSGDPIILSTESVLRWHNGRLETLHTGSFPNSPVSFPVIHYPKSPGFWSQNARALELYIHGRLISWDTRQGNPASETRAVAEDEHGTIWVAGSGKLFRDQNGRLAPVPIPSGCSPAADMSFISAPKLKLVCYGAGLPLVTSAIDGSEKHILVDSLPPSLEPHSPTTFYQDREGILWVGTSFAGLWRVRRQAVVTLSSGQGLRDHNVYPIYQDRAGSIWIGAWPNTLNRYHDGQFQYFSEKDGIAPYISALYQDRDGTLWVGAYGGDRNDTSKGDGLRVFKHGQFVPPAGLRGLGVVRAILQDRHGALWLGCEDKLVRYDKGGIRVFTTRDGLATNHAIVLVEDRTGDLWIGGQGGLTRLSGDRFTPYTVRDGLPSPTVRSLYVDSQNVLWIGTYDGGLGRFENGRFTRYAIQDGLFSNGVSQILEDSRGSFWISSNHGIYRVQKHQLNDFAHGKTAAVTSIAYGKADGMRNIECNGAHWPAGIRARDGRLWFPTQDGVAIIDPEQVPINQTPPSVTIESCLIDHKPVLFGKSVRLRPAQTSLEIQYTALSFVNPERIRFKYKLAGLDQDWIDAASRRTAYYSHLPPGDYSFKVIAANSDGVWNTQGTQLGISVLPPFYKTWWFISAMFVASAGVVIFGWKYRVSQLQRAYAAQQAFSRQLIASQERERKRIAAELHDSLGQQLLIIKNWAMLALSNLDGQKSLQEPLDEISTTASHAVEEMRGIAYNLRPYQLEKLGLTAAIRSLVARVKASSNIRFAGRIEDVDGLFPQEVEVSIYRIVQEALNNTIKHSQASEGSVLVTSNSGTFDLMVEDNGRGFTPPDSRIQQESPKGFGLLGIAERVRLLGGQVVIQSAPGQGSRIQISLKTYKTT
ncbi:MAG TPA: two-component regulator propeller domain-containing protein [Bryobacteraceae bacterium]|nr:two-component regulator propeller domain-containing protein [Bryobacteraceae bacterium]